MRYFRRLLAHLTDLGRPGQGSAGHAAGSAVEIAAEGQVLVLRAELALAEERSAWLLVRPSSAGLAVPVAQRSEPHSDSGEAAPSDQSAGHIGRAILGNVVTAWSLPGRSQAAGRSSWLFSLPSDLAGAFRFWIVATRRRNQSPQSLTRHLDRAMVAGEFRIDNNS